MLIGFDPVVEAGVVAVVRWRAGPNVNWGVCKDCDVTEEGEEGALEDKTEEVGSGEEFDLGELNLDECTGVSCGGSLPAAGGELEDGV